MPNLADCAVEEGGEALGKQISFARLITRCVLPLPPSLPLSLLPPQYQRTCFDERPGGARTRAARTRPIPRYLRPPDSLARFAPGAPLPFPFAPVSLPPLPPPHTHLLPFLTASAAVCVPAQHQASTGWKMSRRGCCASCLGAVRLPLPQLQLRRRVERTAATRSATLVDTGRWSVGPALSHPPPRGLRHGL